MDHQALNDRASNIVICIIVAIVLAVTVFAPPEWSPPSEHYADDPSVTSETLEGRVVQVLTAEDTSTVGAAQPAERAEVEMTSGSLRGQTVLVGVGGEGAWNQPLVLEAGMRVIVDHTVGPTGESFAVSDVVRRPVILELVLLFAALTAAIGLGTGIRSLVGTAFSVLVIVRFVLPRILAGQNPVAVCIVGALLMVGPSLYLVYGWRRKTHAAVISLGVCLVVTWIMAAVFVARAHMTGLGSDEATFLLTSLGRQLDLRGLVLGGVILGTLGVLDDVTIAQASAIFELRAANPMLTWTALFRHGMVIGRDHIASMVNTLIMAYVGAALPLFLLLMLYQEPLSLLLNRELVAEEAVRTLVGSMGLMLAVPVTSLIASWMAAGQPAGGLAEQPERES